MSVTSIQFKLARAWGPLTLMLLQPSVRASQTCGAIPVFFTAFVADALCASLELIRQNLFMTLDFIIRLLDTILTGLKGIVLCRIAICFESIEPIGPCLLYMLCIIQRSAVNDFQVLTLQAARASKHTFDSLSIPNLVANAR